MRAWQPTATKYTAPMFQSIVLRLRWSLCMCVIMIDYLIWSKSLKSHRLINLVVERSRKSTECLSSRHTGKDGANVTFSSKTISFASTISYSEGYYWRNRETNKKLERSFSKTNLDRLSLSWSFSKAELPRGCIWQKLKGSWWWRHRIVLKQSKVHNANSVSISLINLFMVQAKRNSRSFLDKTAWRTKNRGAEPWTQNWPTKWQTNKHTNLSGRAGHNIL